MNLGIFGERLFAGLGTAPRAEEFDVANPVPESFTVRMANVAMVKAKRIKQNSI
jgi:hypothetical protein